MKSNEFDIDLVKQQIAGLDNIINIYKSLLEKTTLESLEKYKEIMNLKGKIEQQIGRLCKSENLKKKFIPVMKKIEENREEESQIQNTPRLNNISIFNVGTKEILNPTQQKLVYEENNELGNLINKAQNKIKFINNLHPINSISDIYKARQKKYTAEPVNSSETQSLSPFKST